MEFFTVKDSNPRNGPYHSLRLRVPGGTPDGVEWGRLRWERGGWNTWAGMREFDLTLRAAVVSAGRRSPLAVAVRACEAAYREFHG